MKTALELRGIVKRFPGVVANDEIDLRVDRGEIRAILGENGAGKTTLMRILYGLERPDRGEILLAGRKISFRTPLDAIRAGVGMVHQHFMLFPSLSVGENVVFGAEPTRRGFLDEAAVRARIEELSERYGLEVEAGARVADLPVGVRQRVEILKTLYREAEILILDEPTTVLAPVEKDRLFKVLRRLAGEGKTVLFITHKLQEVMDLTDRATVLCRGRLTATLTTRDSSPEELGRLMVGHDAQLRLAPSSGPGSREVLRVEALEVEDGAGRRALRDIRFSIFAGEILGVAGVAGNGQTEMVAALAGLRPVRAGRLLLEGRDITRLSVAERRRAGLAYIPEDRNGVGLALDASLEENLLLGSQTRPDFARRGVLSASKIRAFAADLIARFSIKGASQAPAASLSGGHRQRLVVARELARRSPLLIAEQPTQGVDVGAGEFILAQLAAARSAGCAVLFITAELSELLRLSDRIMVMFEGRPVAEMPASEATEEALGVLMAGGSVPQ